MHELWQTDFTHLHVVGWGWYYLSTVLDDFSRYVIAWMLSPTMGTTDVQNTLDIALERTGLTQVHVRHRPRLLSDNGPAYVSAELEAAIGDFVDYYNDERYHESLNNVTPADVYYGRRRDVLSKRAKIKQLTMKRRRKENQTESVA